MHCLLHYRPNLPTLHCVKHLKAKYLSPSEAKLSLTSVAGNRMFVHVATLLLAQPLE